MKLKLTIFILLILLIPFLVSTPKTLAEEPIIMDVDQELRGVWLTPITGELSNYTSEAQFKSEMTETLTILEHYNINALFFHVRTHNNALYSSAINPKASWFSGVDFQTFDPLEWLISETKSRGIEFHAWMNPYRVNSSYYGSSLPASNPASSPSNLLSYNGSNILNPGLPNVREFVIDSVIELVENYDVDAIHFDDYFYINLGANGATSGTTTILDEPDQATFELYGSGFNTSSALSKAEWRRTQINLLISGVKSALSTHNSLNDKYVQFGVSPTGIYKNGNGVVTYEPNGNPITTGSNTGGQTHYSSYLFSDSVKWMTEGWVDYLVPQSYWATNHPSAGYPNVMGWWNAVNKNLNVNLYSGVGLYMSASIYETYNWKTDPNEFVNQLNLLDTYENTSGSSIYSFQYLKKAYLGQASIATTQINNVKSQKWSSIAVLPELKSMTKVMIDEPINHHITSSSIAWNRVSDAKNYYIFASSSPLQYTSSEVVGVIGQQTDTIITYSMSINPNYYYSIVPISKTNTLGTPSVLSGINMVPGASIRTEGIQGLKYQATFDSSFLSMERGFFMVYGNATKADLLSVIENNPMTLNGKAVYKNNNYDITSTTISVVLTGIPEFGYAQNITVFAYAFDGIEYYLVPTGVTRSIGEVAFKAAKTGNWEAVSSVLTQLETNFYTHHMDEFGNYQISGLYETDRVKLRTEFINDWNTLFGTTWTSIDGPTFHAHAKVGALDAGDLSGSRIYQFFNHSTIKLKWGWFLEYLKSQDGTAWTTRQINAIQDDGTLTGFPDLYAANHICYSIANFFINAHQVGGYTSIDFTGNTKYAHIVTYNQSIFIEDEALNLNYKGQTITLPQANAIEGYTITGFNDGVTTHNPGATYTTSGYKILTTEKILATNSITYNLNSGGFYQYISRAAMVSDFITDFNAQSGKSLTATNFYDGTYHASTNYVIDFFNSPAYSTKWAWMKTYITNTGNSTSYSGQANLNASIASTWRSNVWAFINADYRTAWPESIDFTNSLNANGFWSQIEKAPTLTYEIGQEHILEIPFKLGFTFGGWYVNSDFSGSPVTIITTSESDPKIYYAKWI